MGWAGHCQYLWVADLRSWLYGKSPYPAATANKLTRDMKSNPQTGGTTEKSRVLRCGAILVLLCAGTLVLVGSCESTARGRLKLPVGKGSPSICLSERHGLL